MSAERLDFCDGKYTVINDNGKLTALRYGQPWDRDLTGDNLVYWMFCEVRKLKAVSDLQPEIFRETKRIKDERDELLAELKMAQTMLRVGMPEFDARDALEVIEEAIAKATGGQ